MRSGGLGGEFAKQAREGGLKAALDWRDKELGMTYRTSREAEAARTTRGEGSDG
jgi:hypothetical protein